MLDNHRQELYHQNDIMLHRIFIISGDTATWQATESTSDSSGIYNSYLVQQGDVVQLNEAYRFFSNNSMHRFSLTVVAADSFEPSFLQSIVSFVFIPGYLSISNHIVLNLIAVDGTAFETSRQQLAAVLSAHGIHHLQVNQLAPVNQKPGDNGYPMFENSENLVEAYAKTLLTSALPNKLFFLCTAKNDTSGWVTRLRTLEEKQASGHVLWYNAALRIQSLETEKAGLEARNGLLHAELSNYQMHLETIRSSHEAKLLQSYYDKEYEILPLWYKRLGHIVKVMTGKRHLRSLFNNQTKKYKD